MLYVMYGRSSVWPTISGRIRVPTRSAMPSTANRALRMPVSSVGGGVGTGLPLPQLHGLGLDDGLELLGGQPRRLGLLALVGVPQERVRPGRGGPAVALFD